MWTTILFLVLLFVAGLISTNFPRKRFLAWFQSLCVKIKIPSSPSSHAETKYETTIPVDHKVVKRSSYENKAQLKSVFATFDKNNDGYITRQELRDSLNNIGIVMSEKDIADTIRKVDSNGDGLIDLDEFCEAFDSLMGRGEMNEKEQGKDGNDDEAEVDSDGDLKEAFDVFDEIKMGL